jgi:hypothetical protein
MVPLLSLARKPQYQRIERAKRKALEPLDFCNIWIPKLYGIQPNERGFKAACIKELAKITGTGYATIERNWAADFSDRPEWVPRLLRRTHAQPHPRGCQPLLRRLGQARSRYIN